MQIRQPVVSSALVFVSSNSPVAGQESKQQRPRRVNPQQTPSPAVADKPNVDEVDEGPIVAKYVAQKMAHVFGDVLRAQAEREAREEVARALAGFWAAQPAGQAPEPKP